MKTLVDADKPAGAESEESGFDLGCLEDLILKQECLRIVFRAPRYVRCTRYEHSDLPLGSRVEHLVERIKECTEVPFVIVDGAGNMVHMNRKLLSQIASSYRD